MLTYVLNSLRSMNFGEGKVFRKVGAKKMSCCLGPIAGVSSFSRRTRVAGKKRVVQ